MIIYNETILAFISHMKTQLKRIINTETPFTYKNSRVHHNNTSYPIDFVIIRSDTTLGYYDPRFYQIALNERLVYEARSHIVLDILRHETAHFLCFIKHDNPIQAHGKEYKDLCLSFGWDKSISKASMDFKTYKKDHVGNLENEKIVSKVKKLLSLSNSENEHEAQLATVKANQLLLKHHIKMSNLSHRPDLLIERLGQRKKKNATLSAIYSILEHFGVNCILRYSKQGVCLEVCGYQADIDISKYVYDFLEKKLESLWLEHKKEHGLKGLKAKNSFIHGISLGYDEKMQKINQSFTKDEQKALIMVKDQKNKRLSNIYSRVSRSSSSAAIDPLAMLSGKEAGHKLTINKGLSSNKSSKLLGFFK